MATQPPRHRKPWTKKDLQRLRHLARGNAPTRLIALHTGRTEPTIRQKAHEQRILLKRTDQSAYKRRGPEWRPNAQDLTAVQTRRGLICRTKRHPPSDHYLNPL
jgi:hypothetical protein